MKSDFSLNDINRFLETSDLLISFEEEATVSKLLQIQKKIPIFAGIDPLELRAILYDLHIEKLKKGEFLVKEGEKSEEIHYIFNGTFDVFKKNKRIATLQSGDTFGEIGVIFNTPRTASVGCSSEEATILSFKIDQENLDFCAEAIARIYKNLAYAINEKLQKLNVEFINSTK